MRFSVRPFVAAGVVFVLSFGAISSMAQERGGRRGGFDPAQMRARMMERYQESLGVSDDEWKVIQPLVADVMEKQRDQMRSSFRGGMFRGRGRGGEGARAARPDRSERQRQARQGDQGKEAEQGDRSARGDRGGRGGGDADPEVEALSKLLESKDPKAADIKSKLSDLRNARKKKAAALEQARTKLREVLTLKQEAQLVLSGMLD